MNLEEAVFLSTTKISGKVIQERKFEFQVYVAGAPTTGDTERSECAFGSQSEDDG